jgi:hypothetical protein
MNIARSAFWCQFQLSAELGKLLATQPRCDGDSRTNILVHHAIVSSICLFHVLFKLFR